MTMVIEEAESEMDKSSMVRSQSRYMSISQHTSVKQSRKFKFIDEEVMNSPRATMGAEDLELDSSSDSEDDDGSLINDQTLEQDL